MVQDVSKVYKSEFELESYIRSDIYGAHVQLNNSSNPKIRGAVVFHCQGPQLFDYGIRLNHTWAFSGVPDVKSIMDSNGPYLNDLELGVNIVPTLQYGFSGFLTVFSIQFLALQVTNVFEKEQKIREGLCMMGLKDEVFHISWLLIYSLQFAISAAIITVSAMSSLFKYSDKSLVFTYFFVFGISAIMLSFLISTFFSRAKTVVAVGTLIFIILASLLSPTALALGSINFADYDRAHVGLRWSNMWRASSGVNFLLCLLMMVFDSLLYCALGLYCDKVLRGENGTQNLWNYLFQKGSLKTKSTKVESISLEMKQQELDEANQKSTICRLSTSPQSIVIQVLLPTVVMLMLIAVRTRVDTTIHPAQPYIRKGMFVEVVSGDVSPGFTQILQSLLANEEMFIKCTSLSLSSKAIYIRIFMEPMFNSITCQNPKIRGAVVFHGQGPQLFDYSIRLNQTWDFSGFPDVKSITDTNGPYLNVFELGVNIVPTLQYGFSGFLTVYHGGKIAFPLKGSTQIGYCPQFDALLDYLTVKEHLQLYARIKGVSEKRMENVVMEKIVEFDLLKHADKPSFCLSGGNKRKLSVAVAMIGDPPIVILDEPSTGKCNSHDDNSQLATELISSLLDEEVVQIFIKLDEERRKERENEERRKGELHGWRVSAVRCLEGRERSKVLLFSSRLQVGGSCGWSCARCSPAGVEGSLESFSVAVFSVVSGAVLRSAFQSFLQYEERPSLAHVFGCLERNRYQLGIAEYSISQSTLETIFNHFSANA
ncbi:unnamed protein product [Rhodiola kirilowii]